jgi:hypothetical protein
MRIYSRKRGMMKISGLRKGYYDQAEQASRMVKFPQRYQNSHRRVISGTASASLHPEVMAHPAGSFCRIPCHPGQRRASFFTSWPAWPKMEGGAHRGVHPCRAGSSPTQRRARSPLWRTPRPPWVPGWAFPACQARAQRLSEPTKLRSHASEPKLLESTPAFRRRWLAERFWR